MEGITPEKSVFCHLCNVVMPVVNFKSVTDVSRNSFLFRKFPWNVLFTLSAVNRNSCAFEQVKYNLKCSYNISYINNKALLYFIYYYEYLI